MPAPHPAKGSHPRPAGPCPSPGAPLAYTDGMTNDPASDAIEARREPVSIVVVSDFI